jgi:hypothetical protein
MTAPQEVLERPVFSVGGHDYRWADVVAAAREWGRWDELERRTTERLAALDRVEIDEGDVDEAGQDFRYARSLLAADEMEAWLRHWGLTTHDWLAYLRRTSALARAAGTPGSDAGEAEVWAEAVCSGELAELARDLAARAAAAEALGETPGPVDSDLVRLDDALAAFRESAITPQSRAKTLELRGADWLRLHYTALEVPQAGMAREAALCVREDGLSLDEVAGRAGVSTIEREAFLEEVDADLSKPLLSAPTGELVGPVAVKDGFVLLRVNGKVAPMLDDPVIKGLLEEEVPRRAVEREVRNRVRWHERL